QHLHRAQLQRLHLFAVLEEGTVRIDLDLDSALGHLFGELLELERTLAFRRLLGDDVAEFDDDGLLGLHAERCKREDGNGKGYMAFHEVSCRSTRRGPVLPEQGGLWV